MEDDDDSFSFVTLRAATQNVMRYLENKGDIERRPDPDKQKREEKTPEAQRAYIEQRLRELAVLEGRIRPEHRPRRIKK